MCRSSRIASSAPGSAQGLAIAAFLGEPVDESVTGVTSALLVVLAERHLRTGPGGFGLLLGAIGVGAGLGPLLLARLAHNPRKPSFDLRALPAPRPGGPRPGPPQPAQAALRLYGIGASTGRVTYNWLLQAEVADQARGRVFAGFDMFWQTGLLASIALGGLASDAFGINRLHPGRNPAPDLQLMRLGIDRGAGPGRPGLRFPGRAPPLDALLTRGHHDRHSHDIIGTR